MLIYHLRNNMPKWLLSWMSAFALFAIVPQIHAQSWLSPDLEQLNPGSTKAVNALWGENPLDVQFTTTKRRRRRPQRAGGNHDDSFRLSPRNHSLNRDFRLRIFWDGETTPSVDCPLVDFFCDPNGERDWVNTALVNVRQGFNAYFPMPFRKSARVELLYDGPLPAGRELESIMPCYSYVCYHTLKRRARRYRLFLRQLAAGRIAPRPKGIRGPGNHRPGKFVGWNITVRNPYLDHYPVDENEKFFIDGETNASVEFQGLEDSFGFSWGFPPTENLFPLTGYFPFHTNGAAAYRFFVQDAINFHKSLKVSSASATRKMVGGEYTPDLAPPCNFPPPFIGIRWNRSALAAAAAGADRVPARQTVLAGAMQSPAEGLPDQRRQTARLLRLSRQ